LSGFEVVGEAEDGHDAINKAESLKPDLIILDLEMPVMNGLDAASVLKKVLPDARLILFTSHDGQQVELLAKAAGTRSRTQESDIFHSDYRSPSVVGMIGHIFR
jgi:DNA-binding NarL/FixJ family response regulator